MNMNDKLKKFIEDNLDLIDQNTKESWEEIYLNKLKDLVDSTGDPYIVGTFTEMMESAKVYPLKILTFIPSCYLTGSSLESYIIPNNIEKIEYYAFIDSEIKQIEIPKSIKYIGENAFNGCSYLDKIIYDGTINDWKKIIFENTKKPLGTSVKIICTDGILQ